MKQWLNTPVTYGCMIRVLLVCAFAFLLFVSAVDLAFNIGGPHWTAISATILSVLAIIIGPVGYTIISLSTRDPILTDPSTSSPASSYKITAEQAFALLHKQEETHLTTSLKKETGTLIVSTSEENRGVSVYVLPRGDFIESKTSKEREANELKRIGTITRRRFGFYPLYITCFRNLPSGRYNAWTAYGKDNPKTKVIEIVKGAVSELELDWKD